MDLEQAFVLFNFGVIPFWALLIVAPRAQLTARLVHAPVVPVLYGVSYVFLLFWGGGAPEGDMMSLGGVVKIFSHPQTVFAGWVHYLIFDLFIGAWEARDAQRRSIPHLALVPCLVLTLLFGPIGLLCYLALRGAMRKVAGFAETAP
jgi:Domain of unknown function (DUF4281)